MIELKSEQSLTNFVQVCTQFFKSYTQTIPHFFQNAEVFLTPNLKFDENNIADSLKTLFINYRDNGYWFLFEDKFLGKISIHHPFYLPINEKWVQAKILSIHELILDSNFDIMNSRKIGVLNFVYLKTYKNQLKYTPEPVYHVLFFDILTGLKLWEYSSNSSDTNPQTLFNDLKNYFLNYNDESLKLRCQLISLKSPIKEYPLERIIKYLIHPIHYVNSKQQSEMIENLNTILNQEKIQIIYDETSQNILFETYPSNSNSSQNQVFPLDSISTHVQEFHQKIDFLFEKDERLPILHSRLKELEVIYKNECYLSTVVVIGSLLEALLKNELHKLKDDYYRLNKLCKDTKDNTTFKPVKALNFKEMIDIFHNNSIISKTITNLIDSYRDFRNQIHVYHDDVKNAMNKDICEIGFRVLKMLINELYEKKLKA